MDDLGPDVSRMQKWSQEELLSAAVGGNREAFGIFCVRVLPNLIRYLEHHCRQLGVPVHQAHDFAQEAITKALCHIRGLGGRCPPRKFGVAWLNSIGYHLVVDWTRSNHRQQKARQALKQVRVEAQAATRTSEDIEEIREFFDWLSPNEQELIELMLIKGLSAVEAGKEMNLSQAAAYKTFERAITRLRDLVEMHGKAAQQLSRR
jgi:RNA polymerase sigma factor (sigma-70 family)